MKHTSNIWRSIKERREAKGWTQEQLSEITGIHRVTIARYETTNNGMTVENAVKLAAALGCKVDDLIGRKEETA